MPETVTMPKLGFDMAEGTLIRWVKNEGDQVAKGDVLAEIETDKATVEVESTFEGTVARHLVDQGAVVPVSTPIAIIAAPGESVEDAAAAAPKTEEAEPAGMVAPKESQADHVAAPAGATEVVDAKKQAELSAQSQGPAREMPGPAGEAPTGEAGAGAGTAQQPAAQAEAQQPTGPVRASPLARRMAEEQSLDLSRVRGTGPGGRITKKDIEAFTQGGGAAQAAPAQAAPAQAALTQAAPAQAQPQAAAAPAAPRFTPGQDQEIPLTRLRGAIARRMVESKTQVPHFYVTREYDAAPMLALRKQLNEMLPDEEKISVNDFVVKAAAMTLREFPNLNATLQGDKVIRRGAINISVAVTVEGGLLTVVVQNADQKSLSQISRDVKEMAARVREGKIRPEDMEGSTFSTSNLGMYGVDEFSAIINPPEAGILAISAAKQVPVVVDGQVQVGTRMKITLSVDHRVSDGAEGAQFMAALAKYIESPMRSLI